MNNPDIESAVEPSPEVFTAEQLALHPEQVSRHAITVLKHLRRQGFEALLVGGCVRDLLLGLEPKDFDVATDALPEEVHANFRSARIIGRRFRLVHVRFGREVIEVATYRGRGEDEDAQDSTVSSSGRLLQDNVYGTRDEDAMRRDIAVNALYYDPLDGLVYDYHDGITDIRSGILRMIGEPALRFREDPVRMLRVIRFAAKLGFNIEERALESIDHLAHLVAGVPPARLFEEVLKLFQSGFGVATFEKLRQHGLFAILFPDTDRLLGTEEAEFPRTFLPLALANTDRRVQSGRPVIPPFLFAVLLWEPYRELLDEYIGRGIGEYEAIHHAAGVVIERQVGRVAVPRRYTTQVREIWEMQFFLDGMRKRHAFRLLDNRRFRAGYDFLILRATVGQASEACADWWTRIQEVDDTERRQMINSLGGPKAGKRRRRRRPRRQASNG